MRIDVQDVGKGLLLSGALVLVVLLGLQVAPPPGFASHEAVLGWQAEIHHWLESPSPGYSFMITLLAGHLENPIVRTRLPAVLAGMLMPLITAFLCKEIFGGWRAAVVAGGVMALNPWFIQLSRAAFPQTLALMWGGLCLWSLLRKKTILGMVFLCLALVTDVRALVVLPLVAGSLLWFTDGKMKSWVGVGMAVLVAGWIMRDIMWEFYWKESFFLEIGFVNRINEMRGYLLNQGWGAAAPLLFNKATVGLYYILRRIFAPWDWYWWFTASRYPQNLFIKHLGNFYFVEWPFFMIGLFSVVGYLCTVGKKYVLNVEWLWLLVWIGISSLPMALRLRPDLHMDFYWVLPIWCMLVGLGVSTFMDKLSLIKYGSWIAMTMVVFILLGGIALQTGFRRNSFQALAFKQWNFGYEQVADLLAPLPRDRDYFITDALGGNPEAELSLLLPNLKPEQIHWGSIRWNEINYLMPRMLVASPKEIPGGYLDACTLKPQIPCPESVQTVYYPDSSIAVYVIRWD